MSDCNQRNYRNMHSISNCPCGNSYSNNRNQNAYSRSGSQMQQNTSATEHTGVHCHHAQDDKMHGMPLAMSYVPWQRWCSIYEPEKAMKRYTIFQELDKPFMGCRGGMGR